MDYQMCLKCFAPSLDSRQAGSASCPGLVIDLEHILGQAVLGLHKDLPASPGAGSLGTYVVQIHGSGILVPGVSDRLGHREPNRRACLVVEISFDSEHLQVVDIVPLEELLNRLDQVFVVSVEPVPQNFSQSCLVTFGSPVLFRL